MTKLDFIYYVAEKANKLVRPVNAEKMAKNMTKAWQIEAEKFLDNNARELDYKFIYSLLLLLDGNCK